MAGKATGRPTIDGRVIDVRGFNVPQSTSAVESMYKGNNRSIVFTS